MNKKGFSQIIILIFVALASMVLAGGSVWLVKGKEISKKENAHKQDIDTLNEKVKDLEDDVEKYKKQVEKSENIFDSAKKKSVEASAKQVASSITTALVNYNDDCTNYPSSLSWEEQLKGDGSCLPESQTYVGVLPKQESSGIKYDYEKTTSGFKLTVLSEEKVIYTCNENGCK